MTSTTLDCPKCRRRVPPLYWEGMERIRCPACEVEFEQMRFPALALRRPVDFAAAPGVGEANCFFHTQNRAEVACDGCGRYICSVCRVTVSGQSLCPSCLSARRAQKKLPENQRVLHGHIALVLAVLPLLIWPLTLIAAPAALGWCFYGWKKPGSITRKKGRTRFIIAGTIATLEIAAWIFFLTALWLKK